MVFDSFQLAGSSRNPTLFHGVSILRLNLPAFEPAPSTSPPPVSNLRPPFSVQFPMELQVVCVLQCGCAALRPRDSDRFPSAFCFAGLKMTIRRFSGFVQNGNWLRRLTRRFSSVPSWRARQIPTELGKRNTAANFTGGREKKDKDTEAGTVYSRPKSPRNAGLSPPLRLQTPPLFP
jgi:hypothetical protein